MLQKVATTGVDLGSVYDQTLRRIKEQRGGRSRLGMEVLMWVSHAERPLRIDELCHALAVEFGATDLDPENIRPQDTVLESCLGLAVVDQETSTIRPIHYTLQESLSRPGVLPNAHGRLGQTCLTYLNYDQVKRLPADSVLNLGDMPFLEYSSFYWGSHAKIELSDQAKSLALELLNRYDNHISATLLFNQIKSHHSSLVIRHLFTGLHCASYFGVAKVLATLIEMEGCDTNQRDCMGCTPLMWAARGGHEAVVGLLLMRREVDPNEPDNDGRTPLWPASLNGHGSVVRLLLGRDDVNPDRPDNYGRTLLWWASASGKKEVVTQLLTRRDVNPDTPDIIGRTPLLVASMNGHREIVALLQHQKSLGSLPPCPPNDVSYSVLGSPLHDLGSLPLHPNDSWFSVPNPPPSHTTGEDHAKGPTKDTLAYLPPYPPKSFSYSIPSAPLLGPGLQDSYRPRVPNRHHEAIHRIPCPISGCERVGENGFKRRDNLVQHLQGVHGIPSEAMHSTTLFECPVPGCERVGEIGFKRRDNLVQHMRGVHGISSTKRSRVEHSVLQRPSSVIEPGGLEGGRVESGLLKTASPLAMYPLPANLPELPRSDFASPPAMYSLVSVPDNLPELPWSDPASPIALYPLPDNLPELPRSDPASPIAMYPLPDNLPELPRSDPASPIALYPLPDNLPELPRSDLASSFAAPVAQQEVCV